MKIISNALKEHLAQETTTLATIWRLTRQDGKEFFFTDLDEDITYLGNTYLSSNGYTRTAIQNSSDMSADNLDIMGVFDDEAITEEDIRAGLFDYCDIRISLVNWMDLSQGEIKARRGRLGEVVASTQGFFRAELRGLTQNLAQSIGQVYQPECRADLGDSKCKVNLFPTPIARNTAYNVGDVVRAITNPVETTNPSGEPTADAYEDVRYRCIEAGTTAPDQGVFVPTIGATTVDGDATFIAEAAWVRAGIVSAPAAGEDITVDFNADEPEPSNWFNGGALQFETGDNAGFTMEVKHWTKNEDILVPGQGTIGLYLPAPFEPQVGDKFWVYPGCDKRLETCATRFANTVNFRGEPYIPGNDEITRYPDAG